MLGPGGAVLHAAAAAEARAKAAAARAAQDGIGSTNGFGNVSPASAACSEGSGVSESGEEVREWHDAQSAW
jgi:hypothetical protein